MGTSSPRRIKRSTKLISRGFWRSIIIAEIRKQNSWKNLKIITHFLLECMDDYEQLVLRHTNAWLTSCLTTSIISSIDKFIILWGQKFMLPAIGLNKTKKKNILSSIAYNSILHTTNWQWLENTILRLHLWFIHVFANLSRVCSISQVPAKASTFGLFSQTDSSIAET